MILLTTLPTMIVGIMIVEMMMASGKRENSGVYMLVVYGV